MERSPLRLPVGVRDFLPPAASRRRAIAEALLGTFEGWGYDRIITPAFEYLDVIARGLGDGARAAAIRFVEPGTGEVVALRPDITPQVARIAATRLGEVRGAIRLAYEGSVLRLPPGGKGQRELIQAGVELIGSPAPSGDAEVLALAAASLRAAELAEVTFDVGHVALARAALEGAERRAELEELLARKDAGGVAKLARGRSRRLLAALPELHGDPDDVLARARALPLDRPSRAALDELEETLELVAAQEPEARLTLDLGDVSGFAYYTGVKFAAYVDGVGDAVLRGGRYDDLIGRFGRDARATGFAVDVEAIAQAEQARGISDASPPRGLRICCTGAPACRERAYRIAAAVRRLGVRAAVDVGASPPSAGGFQVELVCDGRSIRIAGGGSAPRDAVAAASSGNAELLARALGLTLKRSEAQTKERHAGRGDRRRPVGRRG